MLQPGACFWNRERRWPLGLARVAIAVVVTADDYLRATLGPRHEAAILVAAHDGVSISSGADGDVLLDVVELDLH